MKSRKMVLMNLFIEQEYIDVENCGHSGGLLWTQWGKERVG